MIEPARLSEVAEALQPLGPVEVRRLFGGAGIYLEGRMFALLHGGALYAKVDEANVAPFDAAGCPAFTPAYKSGRRVRMPYRRLPDEAQRPGAEMMRCARLGLDAAGSAASSTRRRARRLADRAGH